MLDDRQRACEPLEECVCEVVYEAVVALDDVETCCCRGEGEVMRDSEDPDRTDVGDV